MKDNVGNICIFQLLTELGVVVGALLPLCCRGCRSSCDRKEKCTPIFLPASGILQVAVSAHAAMWSMCRRLHGWFLMLNLGVSHCSCWGLLGWHSQAVSQCCNVTAVEWVFTGFVKSSHAKPSWVLCLCRRNMKELHGVAQAKCGQLVMGPERIGVHWPGYFGSGTPLWLVNFRIHQCQVNASLDVTWPNKMDNQNTVWYRCIMMYVRI